MIEHTLSASEKNVLKVIKVGLDETEGLSLSNEASRLEGNINKTEELLRSLGYRNDVDSISAAKADTSPGPIVYRSFDELLKKANQKYPNEVNFSDVFTPEEITQSYERIKGLNEEFNAVHRLDEVDIIITALAGILSGALDCAFGGFIRQENGKSVPGPFSDFVSRIFDTALPLERIKELEKLAKVTYDEVNNKTTTIPVDGLSSYFHRLVSLGHDPVLGFVFGVLDMLRGTMTTLDFKGKFIIQAMDAYSDRKAQNLFEAISEVFLHMLSDVNTPKGLPAPFMAMFNKLQFGANGAEKLNIPEMVKSMYGQGYDFRHFCAMSIPVMITEVIVRVSYFIKRISEGHSLIDSIPLSTSHEKKPKLGTMLFLAHSTATAINAGKIALTKDPLNINYPQWLSFASFAVKQLKWTVFDKPDLRNKYVMGLINDEWDILDDEIRKAWQEAIRDGGVIYMG